MRGQDGSGAAMAAPVAAGRLFEYDLLRAAAITGVVLIHATSPLLADRAAAGDTGSARFAFLALINQAARFSVPAFFLLSGFFTALARLPARESAGGARAYLARRLGRLLIPYLTWSAVFLLVPRLLHRAFDPADLAVRFALGWTFTGGYFLIALAQLTLLAPALVRLAERRPGLAWSLCLLLAAGGSALHAVAAYGPGGWSRAARDAFSAILSFGPVWAPFFLAGVMLGLFRFRLTPILRRHRAAWLALGALFLASSLVEFRAALAAGATLGVAASFLKPTSVLFAFAACAALLSWGGDRDGAAAGARGAPRAGGAVRAVATGSYAIYLLHGGLILAALGLALPAWQGLLRSPLGPLALAAPGLLLPLAIFRIVDRRFPGWARYALFG